MKTITFEDMFKDGKWILTLNDNTKYVLDFDNNTYDSYEWYSKMGTLESNLEYWKNWKDDAKYIKRLEVR